MSFIMLIFVLSITLKPNTMNIIAIFGTTVEFSYPNSKEICYMDVDDFTEEFGVEAFQEYDTIETDEGTLHMC